MSEDHSLDQPDPPRQPGRAQMRERIQHMYGEEEQRKLALGSFKAAALEIDQSSALNLSRARDLPPELRNELLQGADDGYPPGYESLLKNYYKELSKAEK